MAYNLTMSIGINDVEQCCIECGKKCCNRRSLGNHVVRSHKELGGLHGYVLKLVLNRRVPVCKCGCGQQVLWHKTLYKFNDYVTGHNSGTRGFCRPGFKHTPEQVAHRNARIKEAYVTRGDEISAKIGTALHEAFKDPVKNKRLSDGQKRGWQDLERKDKARDRAIKLLSEGKIGPHAPFKTCWFSNPFTGQEEFMHSSWETAFLESCIREGYPVTKVHDLRIPYVAPDGTEHVYIPDFIGIEDKSVFEVKGHMRDNDLAKFQALQAWAEANGYDVVFIGARPSP